MFYSYYQKSTSYRFKRFLNKAYAAFASMHKQVTIGTVSGRIANLEMLKAGRLTAVVSLCSLFLLPSALYADDALPDTVAVDPAMQHLTELQVTAERSQFQSDIFRLVSNISQEELQVLPIKTVSDILKYVPGIDLRERGPSGVQADLSMRGGSGKQVIVLLNGINITDAQTEHYSLDLPIDIALVERVEVLQGTNYALDAFAGAINIITKQVAGTPWELRGSMTAGEHALVNPALSARFHRENWYLNTSATYNQSKGYMADTDYKIANFFLQTGYKDFDFQIGAQMKNAGASNFYAVGNANQYDATRTLLASASYAHNWGQWNLLGNLYYRAHYDAYEYYRDGLNSEGDTIPNASAYNNIHWTHTSGMNLTAKWNNDWSQTIFGIDIRDEYINSTNLGVHNRFNLRYFAEERFYWEKFTASIGANGVWNSQFGNDWGAGVNLGYHPVDGLHIFLNANRSIRTPNYTDLYYSQKRADGQYVRLADPNTKAEKAWQTELSLKYEYSHFYMAVSGYYRWGRDIIDWVKSPDETEVTYRSINHSKVNSTGGEATLGFQGYKMLRRAEISYAYCNVTSDAGSLLSLYTLDYLRHKLSLRIEHQIYKGLGASWCLRYENRNGSFSNMQGQKEDYEPIWLLDGSIYWMNDFAKVSLDCKNMTAQRYYDFGGVLQPQEWLTAKVEFTIR